jgi:glycerol-3-phosphate dehydrogenase
MEHIIIIGGGGTAAALAHDLTLRGFTVSVFEKGELLSGTTGRHHGLLHSGARYAVHDPEAARECITENEILRQLVPAALEQNQGYFVAVDDEDMAYRDAFEKGLKACGIPFRKIGRAEALRLEPALNPKLKLCIEVPDATMDAWRLPMHFFATARSNGAGIHHFCEVTHIHKDQGRVTGVAIYDHVRQQTFRTDGDLVVIAAGPWSGSVAGLADIKIPIQPGPGVMAAIDGRVTQRVINRLRKPGEGDIVVPQRQLSILGTSLWLADDPDNATIPAGHIDKLFNNCAQLIPSLKTYRVHSAWIAARPLLMDSRAENAQEISRTFSCIDHKKVDGLDGLVSVIGGKATTLRAMAENSADLICRKLGRKIPCTTRNAQLRHYRHFYRQESV